MREIRGFMFEVEEDPPVYELVSWDLCGARPAVAGSRSRLHDSSSAVVRPFSAHLQF